MNCDRPLTIPVSPAQVLDVLPCVDDSPGPRLTDCQGSHGVSPLAAFCERRDVQTDRLTRMLGGSKALRPTKRSLERRPGVFSRLTRAESAVARE